MKKIFFPRRVSWVFIIILVYIDAVLDLIAGKGMGNPLWKPFVERFGSYIVLILALAILVLLSFFIKILAKIVYKIDKTKNAEEILLTSLVVVYALFDLWLIAVGFLGFKLIVNFRYMIPFLIIAGLIYALWAEHKAKKRI